MNVVAVMENDGVLALQSSFPIILRRDLTNSKNLVKQYSDKKTSYSIDGWTYYTNITQSLTHCTFSP